MTRYIPRPCAARKPLPWQAGYDPSNRNHLAAAVAFYIDHARLIKAWATSEIEALFADYALSPIARLQFGRYAYRSPGRSASECVSERSPERTRFCPPVPKTQPAPAWRLCGWRPRPH